MSSLCLWVGVEQYAGLGPAVPDQPIDPGSVEIRLGFLHRSLELGDELLLWIRPVLGKGGAHRRSGTGDTCNWGHGCYPPHYITGIPPVTLVFRTGAPTGTNHPTWWGAHVSQSAHLAESSVMSAAEIAERYRSFAEHQAHGSSPSLEAWADDVAHDQEMLARLGELPVDKQQPNLVFAAARWLGARPGDSSQLRHLVLQGWERLRAVIDHRSTQTNEPARGAAILLGLSRVSGPIALVEVGASAGLCLYSDRYSYRFSDGTSLDPVEGRSTVLIDIELTGRWPGPLVMPEIVWRAGLDLNPLDPSSPDTRDWLTTLIWPEHSQRRERLLAAMALAARAPTAVTRGDLLTDLPALVAQAPAEATLVVVHSATLAYLDEQQRYNAVQTIQQTGARWLSFEGRGAAPGVTEVSQDLTPDTLFVAALDGHPYGVANGHGNRLSILYR